MRALAILLFSLIAFSSFAVTIKECEKLYKVNSLSCSTKHWDRIAQASRKEVLLEFQLLRENRVKGFIENNSNQERYIHIRWVLHDDRLDPLMSDSHTITILRPNEKSLIDFIFHESSKKPLVIEGNYLRLRNFEVK
jgi:hypothetical protein